MKNYSFVQKISNSKYSNYLLLLLLIVGYFLTGLNYLLCGSTYEMARSSYGIFPITITAAIILSIFLIGISVKLKNGLFGDVLAYLGKNSMVYFAVHQSIAMPLAQKMVTNSMFIFCKLDGIITEVISHGFVFLITLLLCYIFDCCVKHSKVNVLLSSTH